MPKILINEIDKTLPGTPSGYANYSVLIPGFMGRTPILTADEKAAKALDPESTVKADKIQPDTNGIYEFTSKQDFIDTIGLVAPKATVNDQEIYHYGNQMAYELLIQGYTVIYMPITPDTCVSVLTNANTWEIFKDKANYDFRFVTHGLLESSDTSTIDAERDMLAKTLQALSNRHIIEAYDSETNVIKIGSDSYNISQVEDSQLETIYVAEELYGDLIEELTGGTVDGEPVENPVKEKDIEGLVNPNPKQGERYYLTALEAVTGLTRRMRTALDTLTNSVTETTINVVNTNIANLARYVEDDTAKIPGRGDCIALLELDEKAYVNEVTNPENAIIDAIDRFSITKAEGKYCALTVPSVYYKMAIDEKNPNEFGNNVKFPGSFHYLACFMNALRSGFKEWYAAAGYTRGVSSYSVDHTAVTLGEIAINALEPRNNTNNSPKFACNVIANFRGSFYLWGNRTAHPLGDVNGTEGDLVASHFLNIRQLCTTIKKQLYVACRRFTFDPNSDTLWFNFVNAIKPTLEAMKADQGVRDYKILKVYTDKKATLKARIRIIPIEAVEDFDLTVSLEDSFGETAAVVSE